MQYRNQNIRHTIAWFISLTAICFAGCAPAPINSSTDDVRIQNKELEIARSAREVFEGLDDRRKNGEALTPAFFDLEYTWSCRWARAQHDSARTDSDRLTALNDHVKRMKDMQRRIVGWTDQISIIPSSEAAYYVEQAELWVAEAEKK